MKQADMNTVLSNGKRQIFLQLSALAGVVAPIFFAVVFTLDGLVHRDYSAMRQTISALTEERANGWIQITNFFSLGCCSSPSLLASPASCSQCSNEGG